MDVKLRVETQWAGRGRVESTAVTGGASAVNRQENRGEKRNIRVATELKASWPL